MSEERKRILIVDEKWSYQVFLEQLIHDFFPKGITRTSNAKKAKGEITTHNPDYLFINEKVKKLEEVIQHAIKMGLSPTAIAILANPGSNRGEISIVNGKEIKVISSGATTEVKSKIRSVLLGQTRR